MTTSVLVASAVALVCGAASGASVVPHHGAGRPLLLRALTVGVLAAVAPTRVPDPG